MRLNMVANLHCSLISGPSDVLSLNELCREKTCLRGFRSCPTQTGLFSHNRWLEARNFGFRKKRNSIYVAKTKVLISYAKSRFSHDAAQIICQ